MLCGFGGAYRHDVLGQALDGLAAVEWVRWWDGLNSNWKYNGYRDKGTWVVQVGRVRQKVHLQ
jgi:hypothetical protein